MESSLRRFNILDGMVLIAATAPCLSINFDTLLHRAGAGTHGPTSVGFRTHAVVWVCYVLIGFWSLALLILRLRRPRPPWRDLARQPGFVALAAAALGVYASAYVCRIFCDPGQHRVSDCSERRRAAVGGAWLFLITTRHWQAEPSWLDRTARALGISWLILGMANYLVIVLL